MKKIVLLLLTILLFVSCSQISNDDCTVNILEGVDSKPPVLLSAVSESENLIRLSFNEAVIPYDSSFGTFSVYEDGCDVLVRLNSSLKAGSSYDLSGRVCDLRGNSCSITVKVWGCNTNPAKVQLNEFTSKGTGSSPDRTELKVLSEGSTAGFAVYDGIPGDFRNMVVLDDYYVSKGSFIVIWWTDVLPDGVLLHPDSKVWNICAKSSGLSDNNGILTIASSPSEGADVCDCISYSSGESSQFDGWGTKEVQKRVETAKFKMWLKSEPILSKNSTSTRSMSKSPYDGHWFTTITGGSTFGKDNTSPEF